MNELVKINDNNQVTTDSLTVADRFGKRHCDVLRAIKSLKCSKEFGLRNFALSSYINEQDKQQPYYDMTRDGWTFLVMGFTGAKAAEWKEKYINAFNAMEMKLKELSSVSAIPSQVDMRAIGGVVKKCTTAVLKDFFTNLANAETIKVDYPKDSDIDPALKDLGKALAKYGNSQYQKGKIDGMLTGMFDPKFVELSRNIKYRS